MNWKNFFTDFFGLKKREKLKVENCIVGIGNYEEKYEGTRHNIGFEIADCFAGRLNKPEEKRLLKSSVLAGYIKDGRRTIIVKPFTFVNLSGEALEEVFEKFDVDLSRCLVVVDDFNLPAGRVRFRRKGSDGGHNGLKSIISSVGKDFPRMRIGIGPVPENTAVVDFVLGPFPERDRPFIDKIVESAAEAVSKFCASDIESVMGIYNNLDIRLEKNKK